MVGVASKKTPSPPVGAPPRTVTAVRLPQYSKAFLPMLVTLSGIVMLVRLPHTANARNPMLVTLSGIVILVRLVRPKKALPPMLVTGLFSIVTGIINAPDTFLSQPVIVAASPTISYVNDSEPSDDDFSRSFQQEGAGV